MNSPPSDTADSTVRRARWRWRPWRFSLATLLASVTLLGIALGVVVDRAERQRRAIAAIEAAGGVVRFDYAVDLETGWNKTNVGPPGPNWLRACIGDDYFCDVVTVNIATRKGSRATPEALAALADLPKLAELKLDGDEIEPDFWPRMSACQRLRRLAVWGATDEPLHAAGGLRNLRWLVLEGSFSDLGLASLAALREPRVLCIDSPHVTDEGMRHLAGMTKLKTLFIDAPAAGDDGVRHLAGLMALEWLILHDTQVGDEGMAHLGGLPELTNVDLARTRVGDAGITYLSQCKRLKSLDLTATQVSDESIAAFARLDGLKFLNVTNTRITREGLAELQAALPNTRISARHWDD